MLIVLAAAVVLGSVCRAAAEEERSGDRRYRSKSYRRQGAEVGVVFPRYVFPTGDGYADEYEIDGGIGFGFSLMFAVTDVIALEGGMLQTNHKTPDGQKWDMDEVYIGLRYIILHDVAWQPFVGLGGCRLALETDQEALAPLEFRRINGFGGVVYAGVDYIMSSRWTLNFRMDYHLLSYADETIGVESHKLDPKLDGSTL